ncbi:MAG: phytanoyl-CoA dioxygenase [Alphaproteobacteria bacterium]|nr:phytanoyl-CoA dioxygenase [Alphaproteobacteria bacterium]
MPKRLSLKAIERYREEGFYFPVRVMTLAEATATRQKLEAAEAALSDKLKGAFRHKPHLLFTWLDAIVRHPVILDAVEDIIGPNLLCWSSLFFNKAPQSKTYVSWHQDATYWGLSSPDVVTAWVAFSPSTIEAGAMRVMPGTHLRDQIPHRETFAPDNLLTRGQEVAVEVDERQAVDLVLAPGEMSLHHVKLVHGSSPNRSADRRIGFAIRYIPPHVRQLVGRDSALLVRGVDDHGHFDLERSPRADLDIEAVTLHAAVAEQHARILYAGMGRQDVKTLS